MRLARLSHEDSPAFLKDLGVNDSRTLPKTGYITLAPDDRLDCFAVAFRAERQGSPRNPRPHWRSLVLLQKPTRRPVWCGQCPFRQNAVNGAGDGPCCAGCETRVRGHTLGHEIRSEERRVGKGGR